MEIKIRIALWPCFAVRVGQQIKLNDYGVLGLSNEATFSASVLVLRAITETSISSVSVSLLYNPPSNLKSHKEVFQYPVLFNQSSNYITYRTINLEPRTAKGDKSIHQFLIERWEEGSRGIEISSTKIAMDVERLIKDALPSGIPGIDQISKHMGMSSRTLTRRLAENGATFRNLVKQCQETISKQLLKNTSNTISEIAFQTGFSEQSAFSRAFKKWCGQSPLEYRKYEKFAFG